MTDLITPEFIPVVNRAEKKRKCRRYDGSPWRQVPWIRYES